MRRTSGRHYQFGDWEKPETPVDRAYYAQGDTVKLKADDPADGMEFKGWKCDIEGVTIADPTSPETTFTMPDKKVKITAEYQEKQEGQVSRGSDRNGPDRGPDRSTGRESDRGTDRSTGRESDGGSDRSTGRAADRGTDGSCRGSRRRLRISWLRRRLI